MPDNLTRITGLLANFDSAESDTVRSAYDMVSDVMKDMKRGNNRPFIEHPLGVAEIIVENLGLDGDSLAAYFLHEATRFNESLIPEVEKKYSLEIFGIVVGLNKIAAIRPKDTRLEAENYRKLIVSYSTDPRVTLIKLADRLEIMRNLHILPKLSRERKNTETIMLYIPLAHQLGLYNLKSEMENLYLKNADNLSYRTITNKLKATERERQGLVKAFINPLKDKLDKAGIKYELKARTKSAYSIWRKMQAQSVPFEGVYDVFAMRFIIEAPADRAKEHELCWQVYSLVTEEYEPDVKRLRDWITVPKPNGYESLHTTVKNKEGAVMEVQIRTRRMDDEAENGMAAHWAYKGIKRVKELDAWLSNVKKMLESPDKEVYTHMPVQALEEVFVYTPAGDLRKLPKGACVLDFAFEIHSNLGIKCSGAKVNGKVVSIREPLHTGDVVEIMSSRNQKPSADWLNFVVTSKARAKIRQKIKEEEGRKAAAGRELLERRLKNWKLEMDDELMNELVKFFKYRNSNDFLSAIADEDVDLSDVKDFIQKYEGEQSQSQLQGGQNLQNLQDSRDSKDNKDSKDGRAQKKESSKGDGNYLEIGKLNDIGYKMAKCCNPIYGDDVFAFVSAKDGVKIHRMSCPNAARLIEAYPYRIQMVKWKDNAATTSFQVNLKIIVEDELSNGQYIIEEANRQGVSIRSFSIDDRYSGRFKVGYDVKMQVSVGSNHHLETLMAGLKRLKGVRSIVRMK